VPSTSEAARKLTNRQSVMAHDEREPDRD